MRPVNRPNGSYYANSRHHNLYSPGVAGIVANEETKCLALCIEAEIRRLSFIIQGIVAAPAPLPTTLAIANVAHLPVATAVAAGAPLIAGLLPEITAAAGAGTQAEVYAAIMVLPVATKRRIVADIITSANTAGLVVLGGPGAPGGFVSRTIAEITREATTIPVALLADDLAYAIYDAAIQGLPANQQRVVDNYIHYVMIRRNLAYDIRADNFLAAGPDLVVADIPYAISAMQDTREVLRATGVAANRLYATSTAANPVPVVTVGNPPAPAPALVRKTMRYTLADITTHINKMYTHLYNDVNAKPSPYTDAADELLDKLGAYCSYCEARFVNEMNVEHILPKGTGGQDNLSIHQGFPTLAKSWLNFLPACGRCNSTKNAKPTKHDITAAAIVPPAAAFTKDDNRVLAAPLATVGGGATIGGDNRITDQEYARLYQDHFQFPLEAASYQNVGFRLFDVTSIFKVSHLPYTATSIQNQQYWTIQKVDEVNKEVIVNTPGAAQTEYKFEVHVDQWGAGALLPTVPAALSKVDRMANMCGLNSTWTDGDRRTVERTEAWFMALEAVNRITTDLGPGGLGAAGLGAGVAAGVYNRVYQLWRDNTIRIIKEKGFLSIWLKIFKEFAHPLPLAYRPTFPDVPTVAGGVFVPMIGGAATGGLGAIVPTRGAVINNLAQDIAQTILQTGEGVNDAAQKAAGIALGIAVPVPMAGAASVGLAATWAAAAAPTIALAEAAARKAGAAHSRFFPNTNWNQVP